MVDFWLEPSVPAANTKICCIADLAEAQMAIGAGASSLGLVSAMPSGPGVIADELIAEIAASVPANIATFLLTMKQDAQTIARQHQICKTTTIQLVDHVAKDELRSLRRLLPQVQLVQVIHVNDEQAIGQAIAMQSLVDMILLDSGNQHLAIKELGGTGRTHDWNISRELVARVRIPVFLAGGLRADNVANALKTVRPFGLDLCSSVRTDGRLDPHKLHTFMAAAQSTDS
jgi:phosphoribosylanthranilate isomerase